MTSSLGNQTDRGVYEVWFVVNFNEVKQKWARGDKAWVRASSK